MVRCLCNKLSKANQKITELECKNFSLVKENERLENRIDLLENRPIPRHYLEPPCDFGKEFYNQLDMYTLEKIINDVANDHKRLMMNCSDSYECGVVKGYEIIMSHLWDMLDDDSKEWIRKGKDEYYK